jgi:glycosyltransferase involved in cell wall biosynthesis
MRYPQAFPPMQRAYLQSQVRRSVRAARRVIAVSQATKAGRGSSLACRPLASTWSTTASTASFCPAPAGEVEAFRRQQGLPERYILHLGTLEPRKNLVRLVQAFAQVRSHDAGQPPIKLVLAGGKGWDYEAIFAEVSRLGLEQEVLFPGYVADEELAWWYRAATLFVYPSLLEGFGLPVLEAMACGAPTVTSNLSSLPEVAGDAALLVDPTSVDALATALLCLLRDTALTDELRARAAPGRPLPLARTAQETAAVYRRALCRPCRSCAMNRYAVRLVNWAAVAVDIGLILAAFALAYLLRYQFQWFREVDPAYYTTLAPYIPMAALQGGLTLLAFALSGVYRFRRGASLVDEIYGVINGVFTGFVVTVFFIFFWRPLGLLSPLLPLCDSTDHRLPDHGPAGAPRHLTHPARARHRRRPGVDRRLGRGRPDGHAQPDGAARIGL